MKKRILATALALCMVFGSAASLSESTFTESTGITASAAESTKKSGNYEYKLLKDGSAMITKYNGKESKVSIPSKLGGKTVSSIGHIAFSFCTTITSVTIPDSVTEIGDSAFIQCSKLTSVDLGKNTIKIGKYAFAQTKLTSVSIPYSTTTIGEHAFEDCISLKKVYIGGGRVKSIDNYAFSNCKELSSLELGNAVSAIGSYAFKDCTSLKTLTVPDSVNGIYQRAFEGCSALTTVVIGNSVKSIGNGAFIKCGKLKNITFGVSLEKIGEYAFDSCSSLTKVELMPSTKEIGEGAFGGCSSVKYAFLPGVENINPKAFMYCTKLSEVYFSDDKIRSIGEEAFVNCPELKKIGIPNSVTTLRAHSFGYKHEKNNKYSKYSDIYICGSVNFDAEKYAKSNGFKFQSIASHKHVNKTVTVPNTCTKEGYQITLCKYCGNTTKKNITAPKGHSFCEWKTISFDVDKKTAAQSRKCSKGDKSETRTVKNAIVRYAGSDRAETAAKISKAVCAKTSNTVIIATGFDFHDALAAVPLASAYNAPLLLADRDNLSAKTIAEIKRLKAKNVIVVASTNAKDQNGYDAAIKSNVYKQLKKLKVKWTKLDGKTYYETAKKVAVQLKTVTKKNPTSLFITTDKNYADALSASPVAAVLGAPILYVDPKASLNATTKNYLTSIKKSVKNVYIVGGVNAVSKNVEKSVLSVLGKKSATRFAGDDRYETCVLINKSFSKNLTGKSVCIAKGYNFPDALAGGVFAAKVKAPLFLADKLDEKATISKTQSTYLSSKNPNKLYIFGGEAAVPTAIVKTIAKASV